jgi:hypothetical protein
MLQSTADQDDTDAVDWDLFWTNCLNGTLLYVLFVIVYSFAKHALNILIFDQLSLDDCHSFRLLVTNADRGFRLQKVVIARELR